MGMLKGVAALALSTMVGISTVQAQSPVTFDLGGGASVPLGDFSDMATTGWQGMAGVSFAPPAMPVGFRVDGMFQQFGTEGDQDVNVRVLSGTANVLFAFPTAATTVLRPYLIGGVGVYNSKLTGEDVPALLDESETDFGLNAGAGFRFRAGAVGLFVEGRFHSVFTEGSNTNFIPITAGITLGGS